MRRAIFTIFCPFLHLRLLIILKSLFLNPINLITQRAGRLGTQGSMPNRENGLFLRDIHTGCGTNQFHFRWVAAFVLRG